MHAAPCSEAASGGFVGGIATNGSGSLFAHVNNSRFTVDIRVMGGGVSAFGTMNVSGRGDGLLSDPTLACFTLRQGVETLLVCDCWSDRVVEVSVSGTFMRATDLKMCSHPAGVAFCPVRDAIAVSLQYSHAVILLDYKSSAVIARVGGTACGVADGFLNNPRGVRFTADGARLVVADSGNNRVSTFDACSGAFVAHVATHATHGIRYPTDILVRDGGRGTVIADSAGVVCIGEDGGAATMLMPTVGRARPWSLCELLPTQDGVVVKLVSGTDKVVVLTDVWLASLRCAWVSVSVLRAF